MAKDKLTDYDSTASGNLDVGGISVAEGMLPSNVNNAIREQMSHLKDFADGTEAINALAVDNLKMDGNTISSTDTNGDITLDPNGTGDIVLDANVGIGTSLPVSALTVEKGNVTGAGQWASSAIALTNPTNIGAYSQIGFGYTPSQTNASSYIGYVSTNQGASGYGDLVFGTRAVNTDTQPSERMRINSSGNLLVGKTAVDSNAAGFEAESDGKIAATRDGSRTAIFNRLTSDGEIVAFRKDGSAVGSIGTASGGVSLGSGDTGLYFESVSNEIRPFNTTTNASIDNAINLGNSTKRFKDLYLSGGALTNTVKFLANTTVSGSDATIFRPADNTMAFSTNGAERMRIDSSGQMLLGTTSANGSQILQLSAGGVQWSTGPNTINGSFDVFNASGTGVYLSSGSTSWVGISDERYKDIIEPITNASEKVSALRPIIGKYKTDEADVRRSFLIAQDVQAVFPEAVDAQDESKLGLRYADLIPLLTGALQEAIAKIETLEARIAALEAN